MTSWITVKVAKVKGSAPREVGAFMEVWKEHQVGSIGGGALEWEASRIAAEMLENNDDFQERTMPLGPDLGQCCGGVVTLEFTRNQPPNSDGKPDLWIWGAGHVGRAIANIVAPLNRFEVVLIDTTTERMPDTLDDRINPLIAAQPTRLVDHAPKDATHIILTYSHDIDFALCDALLRHDQKEVGVIGSATKWARFRKRLEALGHEKEAIAQIICPIGEPNWGKAPQAIAVGVAAALISGSGLRSPLGEKTE